MNFLKRAWLALKAKKSRSLLLILVTSAILIFVLAGLTIQKAANKAIDNAKNETGSTATLQVNMEKMMKKSQSSSKPTKLNMPSISLKTANKIAQKADVKSYTFTSTTTASEKSGIEAITSSSSTSSSNSNTMNRGPQMGNQGDFTITGVNQTTFSDSSSNQLVSGSGITSSTADNEVVIEKSLAKANNLKVGSTFKVTTTVDDETKTFTLKVIGIYKSSATVSSSNFQNTASNPSNNIYTNLETANTMKGKSNVVDSAVYTVKNPKKLSSFVKSAKKLINTNKFTITTDDQVYQQMLTPLNNVASFSKNIVILVSIAGAVILTLIIILSVRERRYEIGVLMSLGESRLKIIFQFFTELFIVTLVSIVIASVAGNFVGNAVGNQLLQQETTSTTQNSSNSSNRPGGFGNNGGGQGQGQNNGNNRPQFNRSNASSQKANIKKINKLNIKQTPSSIAKLGLIAIIIDFIATILASIGIIRMKPKDILSSN